MTPHNSASGHPALPNFSQTRRGFSYSRDPTRANAPAGPVPPKTRPGGRDLFTECLKRTNPAL